MLEPVAYSIIASFVGLVAYTYAGYPALLYLLGRRRRPAAAVEPSWPSISILVAAYNEEREIRHTVERLLDLDYPPEKRQILIVSDASSDRTDEIVREYAHRGIELLRVEQRGGKTAAENAASGHLRGEIIVNTDASIRIRPDALKPMIAAFADPTVGVVSGCDVSISAMDDDANKGEAAYVGYEMWVRELETRIGGIVGASGCFFAIRAELQRIPAPTHLSRDFAAALVAREHGMKALSAPGSICYVPRSNDLHAEYRRKVRTFTRGMETLLFKRHLLNPFEEPLFAWKLFSHKVTRWLIPWAALAAYLALAALATRHELAGFALIAMSIPVVVGVIGWRRARPGQPQPRWVSIPAYVVAGSSAVLRATVQAMRGERAPIWEPTRRNVVAATASAAPSREGSVGPGAAVNAGH